MLTGYLSTFCIGKSYKRYLFSRFCVRWEFCVCWSAPTTGDRKIKQKHTTVRIRWWLSGRKPAHAPRGQPSCRL
ncbi:hypothetical protein ACN38_g2520 [Penicillium nordicum]|uniref:Uncharacterized protein n=1 Tax=Penicillium nordicum TaxID=229535 RepID=A0A0M8P9R7_9EURO|nr:hypothetical protein ACN38_g2520 [Penicillium nordicum]